MLRYGVDGMKPTVHRLLMILAAGVVLWGAGCTSAQESFTGGRIQNLCSESLVICSGNAGCTLDDKHYFEGVFPGTIRVVVHSELPDGTLTLRFLLTDMKAPGTEIVMQAYEPGCGDLDEERVKDVDLFDLAGDEGILEFDLSLKNAGDHLLEIFSDMSSGFLLTTEVTEKY